MNIFFSLLFLSSIKYDKSFVVNLNTGSNEIRFDVYVLEAAQTVTIKSEEETDVALASSKSNSSFASMKIPPGSVKDEDGNVVTTEVIS